MRTHAGENGVDFMHKLCLILTALLLTGCTDPVDFKSPLESLVLSVEPSRTVVRPGDTLSITIRAFNPTNYPIDLPVAPCTSLMYRVFAPGRRRIAPPEDLRCGHIGSVGEPSLNYVPAGDTAAFIHRWSAIENYHKAGPAVLLAPGNYEIVGGVHGEPDLRLPSGSQIVTVIAQ